MRINHKKGDNINGLVYIKELEKLPGDVRVALFRCLCGMNFRCRISSVRQGNTKSCGCYQNKYPSNYRHGDAITNHNYIYNLWRNIKKRCYSEWSKDYKRYGGRGIAMHKKWKYNYVLFKLWILENLGERPEGHSIDRIDNDGNYEPGNLRWADDLTQRHNQERFKNE